MELANRVARVLTPATMYSMPGIASLEGATHCHAGPLDFDWSC